MKLKYQLFVVLLIASALLIALMLAVNSVSFHRQFITYVNSAEVKRLEPLVEELAALYNENGNWNWVNKRSWGDLLRKHSVQSRAGQLRPPGKRSKSLREAIRPDIPNNTRPKRSPPRPAPSWLTLVDEERSVLIGPAPSRAQMEWLTVKTDKQVAGHIGFVRHKQFSRTIDKEFARQQRRNFLYAALAMAGLCALIAAPLAARIIRPLTSVNNAIAALSGGDYSHRTQVRRKDEIGDLAKNINRLGDTLEQNKAARQRWIAEISHELRTPVAVLQAEIEAIQDGIRSANDETIASLHAEILRLSRLIDDLHQLSVSDLGALDYRMTTLALDELIAEFLEGHQTSLQQASIALEYQQQPATVQADPERMSQLLQNLLQNTVRYTRAPGQLAVSVSSKNNKVTITWSDSAPGVSDDDLGHLFEPLYRAEKSRSRQTSGSGLGLSIVQKIVAAHEGTITATHSDNGGLTLVIELPAHIKTA